MLRLLYKGIIIYLPLLLISCLLFGQNEEPKPVFPWGIGFETSYILEDATDTDDVRVINGIISTLANKDWNFESIKDACSTHPIVCNEYGQVVELNFSAFNYEGSISYLIGDLLSLRHLDLSHNLLKGSLPIEITYLKDLEIVRLNNNMLIGPLSEFVSNLREVEEARFYGNKFSDIDQISTLNNLYLKDPRPIIGELDLIGEGEQLPRFPGCEEIIDPRKQREACSKEKMVKYIYSKIKYPSEARKQGIEGTPVIQYTVDQQGNISNAKILRDTGGGLGYAALELVRGMNYMEEKWTPGVQNDRFVKVIYTLPIKFKLAK